MGTTKTVILAYNARSNGQVEAFNKTIKTYLKTALDNQKTLDWEPLLPMVMFSYNTSVHRSHLLTPLMLMFNRPAKLPNFSLHAPKFQEDKDTADNTFINFKECYEVACKNSEKARNLQKHYYDLKTKNRDFNLGDKVYVNFPQKPPGVNKKFYATWRGIYIVTNVLSPVSVEVSAYPLEPENKRFYVHVDRIKLATSDAVQRHFDAQNKPRPQEDDESQATSTDNTPEETGSDPTYSPPSTELDSEDIEPVSEYDEHSPQQLVSHDLDPYDRSQNRYATPRTEDIRSRPSRQIKPTRRTDFLYGKDFDFVTRTPDQESEDDEQS